jgi:hypothetical protein
MNTTTKQDQKNQRQKAQPKRPKKQGQNPNLLLNNRKHHEQEYPETRMTR